MEYLKTLIDLHEKSGEILEKIISEKQTIECLEESQKQFKNTFGNTSAQFAHQILVAHRKIKILSRSYTKIIKQIIH